MFKIDYPSKEFRHRAKLTSKHWADAYCEPKVKAKLKVVQPTRHIT